MSRPQTGLSFLGPEPEDLEDLYSRYKVRSTLIWILPTYRPPSHTVPTSLSGTYRPPFALTVLTEATARAGVPGGAGGVYQG